MGMPELVTMRKRQVLEEGAAGNVDPRLRLQAQQIIDEVLAGVCPSEEGARTLLRHHVEDNPGRPERALLIHLMTIHRP